MQLPTKKSEIKTNIEDYILLIYGPPKIGKTEFCAQNDNSLFIMTEKGYNAQSLYAVDAFCWEDLQKAYELVADGDHPYKTIVIDTIDNVWEFAKQESAKEYGQKHIADVGYGKGQAKARDKIKQLISGFAALPYGLILISHSRKEDIETPVGTLTRETINIVDGKNREAETSILALVDMIMFFTEERVDGEEELQRVIRTAPSDEFVAGGRIDWIEDGIPLNYQAAIESFNKNRDAFLEAKEEAKSQKSLDLKTKK